MVCEKDSTADETESGKIIIACKNVGISLYLKDVS